MCSLNLAADGRMAEPGNPKAPTCAHHFDIFDTPADLIIAAIKSSEDYVIRLAKKQHSFDSDAGPQFLIVC